MANPTVDKLKAFGLRHGEKVAMGVVAVIFATCTYFAWSHPVIEVTADEVEKTAKAAQANISKPQNKETIIAKLTEQGVKPLEFEKKVIAMQSGGVDASQYKLARPFVLPEPGAGLIREVPQLLAPESLVVHSGRGAVRLIKVDDEGNPIPKSGADEKKSGTRKERKKSSRSGGLGGMYGGMGGMGGNNKKSKAKSGALAEAEKKKDEEEAEKRKLRSFAGDEEAKKDDDKA